MTVSTSFKLKVNVYLQDGYGTDVWILDAHTCVMFNGTNIMMVVRITGKSPHEDVSSKTHTFDVATAVGRSHPPDGPPKVTTGT